MKTKLKLLAAGDTNTKLRKSGGRGYLTCGLSLAPHKLAGVGNVCPHASPACIDACLNGCGLGAIFESIQRSRILKTQFFYADRSAFLAQLCDELDRWQFRAAKQNLRLACRLNVFSDIAWELHGICDEFPNVQFYDYSKNPKRFGAMAPNYWVTFSRSETNDREALDVLEYAGNVAVVFHNVGPYAGNRAGKQILPRTWHGYQVLDGDTTDLRFDDTRGRVYGRVVGLRLKSPTNVQRQAAIDSGFSIEVQS